MRIPAEKLEAARALFDEEGMTVTQWADRHGFRREDVYAVLSGRSKGRWGNAHAIAVALRLKPSPQGRLNGEPEQEREG